LTEENHSPEPEELQLAQRVLELSSFVQQNAAKISELTASIEDVKSHSHEYEVQLGSKFTELTSQLTKKIEDGNNNLQGQISNLEEKHLEMKTENQDLFSKHDAKMQELRDTLHEQESRISDETQEREAGIKSLSEQFRSEYEIITNKTDDLMIKIDEMRNITQTHSQFLNEIHETVKTFKEKIQEIIILSKKDQQTHFENFSRILESVNENIHTELTLTAQNLRESDIQILNEVSEHYARKKASEELKQSITNLSEELKAQNARTREDLNHSLKNSVKEYETMIEDQSRAIQDYKTEMDRIQAEIQAIIDRKVNEKYEAVFSLLATVTVRAEELNMLLKTAEINVPSAITSISLEKNEETE
jgi:chromosome segregation ATPase